MSQRLLDTTKCLYYVLALQAASVWIPVKSVTVRTPPSIPGTVEAQAKFFQDFFSVQLSPYKIEFGHVCEDPNTWEQRYEKKDFKNHRDMGKVRWGDKKGGYGEHYWDLNHAGHAGNHGNDGYDSDHDDGAYHENDHDSYDEPSENSPSYGKEEYNPEKVSTYEENGRAKRGSPRVKLETEKPKKESNKEILHSAPTHEVEYSNDGETYKTSNRHPQRERNEHNDRETYMTSNRHPQRERNEHNHGETYKTSNRHPQRERNEHNDEETYKTSNRHTQRERNEHNDGETYKTSNRHPQRERNEHNDEETYKTSNRHPQRKRNEQHDNYKPREHKNQIVLVVTEKDDAEEPKEPVVKSQPDLTQYVPYEGGAGVRQHQHPEITTATSIPRLFLEPSTGHVVDRATGQAYVLQPIALNNNYKN